MKSFIEDLIYIWKYEGKLKVFFIIFLILSMVAVLGILIVFEVIKFLAVYKYINI